MVDKLQFVSFLYFNLITYYWKMTSASPTYQSTSSSLIISEVWGSATACKYLIARSSTHARYPYTQACHMEDLECCIVSTQRLCLQKQKCAIQMTNVLNKSYLIDCQHQVIVHIKQDCAKPVTRLCCKLAQQLKPCLTFSQ